MWVREHRFLAATGKVELHWQQSGIWFTTGTGDDTETHYPLGSTSTSSTPTAARPAAAPLARQHLHPRPGSGRDHLHPAHAPCSTRTPASACSCTSSTPTPRGMIWGTRRYSYRQVWLRLWGPGRVAVQSVFERPEDSGQITSHSHGHHRTVVVASSDDVIADQHDLTPASSFSCRRAPHIGARRTSCASRARRFFRSPVTLSDERHPDGRPPTRTPCDMPFEKYRPVPARSRCPTGPGRTDASTRRAAVVQRRPARRQPGPDRPDGPGPQAADVRDAGRDGLQGDRGRVPVGVAARLRLRPPDHRGGPASPTTSPSRCWCSAGRS